MRYFTLELYRELEDDEAWSKLSAATAAYQKHIDHLRESFGPDLFPLTDAGLVDDALIARVQSNRKERTLDLTLRCGNLQVGYFDAALHYEDFEVASNDLETLAGLARGTRTHRIFESDGYAHELDVIEGGKIEHRLLFNPGVTVIIRCRRLTWTRTDRAGRQLPRLRDRFVAR